MKRLIIMALLASGAWAADYSHMSTDEMMNMRGSVPVDDRSAFREEMQKRMQSMSPEERQKYRGKRQNCMKKRPTFEQYDLNNDGKITQNELEEARAIRMNQKAKEGKMLRNTGNAPAFSDMDKNKDGSLNKEEFHLHQTEQMKKYNKGCCTGNAPTFAGIDTNKDGVISEEEFRVHQTQRMKNKGNCTSGNCP